MSDKTKTLRSLAKSPCLYQKSVLRLTTASSRFSEYVQNVLMYVIAGTAKKRVSARRWCSRTYRRQRVLMKTANSTGQCKITAFFDIVNVSDFIDANDYIRKELNSACGNESNSSVQPILRRLLENAERNNQSTTSKGNRHDQMIKKFACSLFCLIGKAGYQLLQVNLGNALPSIVTVLRDLATKKKVKEGDFLFDELVTHLKEWKAPMYIHIHLDDTRIINRVEYDVASGRFVGYVLPISEGLPSGDAFVLESFDQIKETHQSATVAKYAHCIVAKPVNVDSPSFLLFVLGTDSKYTHTVITQRWRYIEKELLKRGVRVLTNGADGAGPFLKAMVLESGLFKTCASSNVPPNWSFYLMPKLLDKSLSVQDTIHLLAKLRTRLITPSNLVALGSEIACRGHLIEVIKQFEKAKHGLTYRSIDNKDKQNYTSIPLLVSQGVEDCLIELDSKLKTMGTRVYLGFMRDIRDAFFNKTLSPLRRLYLIWKTVFIFRIWRSWLSKNGYSEEDHFITSNAYTCVELNGHMMANLVFNVAQGIFPPESMRT